MSGIPGMGQALGTSPAQIADYLQRQDARLRASVVREVAFARAIRPTACLYAEKRIRTLSRQRMEIRHALRVLRNPARALAALRVV